MSQFIRHVVAIVGLAMLGAHAEAQVWAPISRISGTMGNVSQRLCVGGARDFVGCPTYAPSVTTAGHVSITGNVSANRFIGDGAGLTNLPVANAASSTGAVQFNAGNALAGDTANFFWDNANKSLGIGTVSPTDRLEVVGGDIIVDKSIQVGAHSNNRYSETSGAGGITLSAAGDYGSNGTNIQLSKNASSNWANIYLNTINMDANYTASGNRFLHFYYNGANRWAFRGDTGGNFYLSREAGTGNLFVPTGNVAIGVMGTAPVAPLHISRTIGTANGALVVEGDGAYGPVVRLKNTGTAGADFFMAPTASNWTVGGNGAVMGFGVPTSTNAVLQLFPGTVAVSGTISATGAIQVGSSTLTSSTLHVGGRITGGFGAIETAGTLDWNHWTNAISGSGRSLLRSATSLNAPPAYSTSSYFHPFSFEYNSQNGTGDLTQFAVPYGITSSLQNGMFMRGRYQGTWSDWYRFVVQQPSGLVNITGDISVSGTVSVHTKLLGNAGDGASAPTYTWTGDTNTGMFTPGADMIGFTIGGAERMRLASGILSSFGDIYLDSDGSTNRTLYFRNQSTEGIIQSDKDLRFNVGGSSERMRILNTGYIGLSGVNPGYLLDLPNTANTAGQGRANAWQTYSDGRFKMEQEPITHALDKVLALRGITYRSSLAENSAREVGFIAQEVRKVMPEVVTIASTTVKLPDGTSKTIPDYHSMDYARLVPVLAEAIKDLSAANDDLRDSLKAANDNHAAALEEMRGELDALKRAVGGVR